ncbi:MAG: histidine kinase dimerization/phospho-acceptor domain-containing protein, partial [Thiohalocapsa sp.]
MAAARGLDSASPPERDASVGDRGDDLGVRQRSWIKRLLPQSMFGRSLLLMVMPLVLVQVIATWVFYARHWETVSRRLSADTAGDIGMVIDAMRYADTPQELAQLLRRDSELTGIPFGYTAGGSLPPPQPEGDSMLEEQLRLAMNERVGLPYRLDATSDPHDIPIRVAVNGGVLSAEVPRNRVYTSTTYVFVLWMIGSSLVFLAVAVLFLRNQVKSLRRLAAAAEGFGKGRPVVFTKLEGALEVRQAAAAFMQMRDRIERQIRQRTEILAGVSHDLRTPLTRMKIALALMNGDPAAAGLTADVAEMERLVNIYLDFARGEGTESPVETDLALVL